MDKLEHPFMMVMAAPRKKGKTFLIEKMLTHRAIKDNYDKIVVMSPTLKFKPYYKQLLKKDDELAEKMTLLKNVSMVSIEDLLIRQQECAELVERHNEKVDEILELGGKSLDKTESQLIRSTADVMAFEEAEEENLVYLRCPCTLLILDDIIDSNVTSFHGVTDKIAERGRHFCMSGIFSTQRITAISRSIRINADYFIIFAQNAAEELEQFIDRYISRNEKKEMRKKIAAVLGKPFQFVYIDNDVYDMRKKLKSSNASDFVDRNKAYTIPSSLEIEPNKKWENI